MKAAEVVDRLRARHPEEAGEWLVLVEPFNIDVFALGCWRGKAPHYRRVAYEVKVSWSDYKREIDRPFKRARALELSHQFYFAAPAELALKIQASGSLPPETGLVRVDAGRTVVMRPAPKRPAEPLGDAEVADLLRWRHNPAKQRAIAQRASSLERALESREKIATRAQNQRDRAFARLEQVGGLVRVGQRFRGRFSGMWDADPDDGAVGTVERLDGPRATVRIDGSPWPRTVRVGELVSCFEAVAV